MNVPIFITPGLQRVLNYNRVEHYGPAYDGESVGLDLYYIGDDTRDIYPHKRVLLPTGLKVAIPKGYVGLILERSSVHRTPLKVRAGVIDPGYTDEMFVSVVNVGNPSLPGETVSITPGAPLPFQLVIVPALNQFEAVDKEAYAKLISSALRDDGKLGSSRQ